MTSPSSDADSRWASYLERFHEHRSGITGDVLSESRDLSGADPYGWLTASLPRNPDALALDLACGSGPLQDSEPLLRWVGLDRSAGELARAAAADHSTLLRGDGRRQPFRDATFELVACSMALMLFNPVDDVIAEIRRVLREHGTLALLLPGSVPLSISDRLRYVRLLAVLRTARPTYPNDVHLGRLHARLERLGFAVVSDERRCFRYPVRDEHHVKRFVTSLYTPGLPPERLERAVRTAGSWIGSTIGIPLRRVVCERVSDGL